MRPPSIVLNDPIDALSVTAVSDMKAEILHIQNHAFPYEVYESEIKLDRRDRHPITLFSFVFNAFPSPLLDDVAIRLWAEVARRFLTLKKQFQEKSNGEVIGRISFKFENARVEYEFSRLTRNSLLNLVRIGQFVKQYPESDKIRSLCDGTILVSFRSEETGNDVTAQPGEGVRLKIRALLKVLGEALSSHGGHRR
jgi:hypothetical protein